MATQTNKDLKLLGGSIALIKMRVDDMTVRFIANPLAFKPLANKKNYKN